MLYQQTAFDMLLLAEAPRGPRSSKEKGGNALPADKKDHLDKYRYPLGDPLHFLMARRLVEAGAPIVHFSLGYWDWHGENFIAGL